MIGRGLRSLVAGLWLVGGFSQVIPDISRADFERLRFGTLPHEPALESMVTDLFPAGSKQARDFFDTRKIVQRVLGDGKQVVSVTSNIWEKVSRHPTYPVGVDTRPIAGKGQRRVYELAQVLTDSYLLDKFALAPRQVSTARTMAVANAVAAASYLQACLRENPDFRFYEVTAGKYARSRKWARDSIAQVAAGMGPASVRIESAVIGEKLFLYGPSEAVVPWSVFGPMWYAAELKALYAVVSTAGPAQASFVLGIETTLLDLDVESGGAVMSPVVELHVGAQATLPVRSSAVTQELLSSGGRQKLESFSSSIETVLVDGEASASAVRISPGRVLVNTHVLQSGDDVAVGSGPLTPQRSISRDLWVARCCRDEFQAEWPLRAPVVGEQVVVCYKRGDVVQYTSPMSVRMSDGSTVVMSLTSELCPGMSGGAIVALHDMALLGVYSGVGAQQAVGAVFSQEHYTDLCTSDAASEMGRLGASLGDGTTYERMRSRGLGKLVDRAIEALQPLYDGQVHVGMGYQLGGSFRTTCNVDSMPLTVGDTKRNLVFGPMEHGVYSAMEEASPVGELPVVRDAQFGEKVFVVGRDTEGPYFGEVGQVRHIGVARKSFLISGVPDVGDLPLHGGLVIATVDGAVVGQYDTVVSSIGLGSVVRCVPVEPAGVFEVSGQKTTFVEWAARVFPMLHMGTWPPELIEEVLTHSSAGRYVGDTEFRSDSLPLAYVGDAVAKLQIGLSLREQLVPSSQWQLYIQACQMDRVLAARCEELGLSAWIRVGRGVKLPTGAKPYATMLEALLGAVYLQETSATVREFCLAVGFVCHSYGLGSDVDGRTTPTAL